MVSNGQIMKTIKANWSHCRVVKIGLKMLFTHLDPELVVDCLVPPDPDAWHLFQDPLPAKPLQTVNFEFRVPEVNISTHSIVALTMALFGRRRWRPYCIYPIVNQIWVLSFMQCLNCFVFSQTQQLTICRPIWPTDVVCPKSSSLGISLSAWKILRPMDGYLTYVWT